MDKLIVNKLEMLWGMNAQVNDPVTVKRVCEKVNAVTESYRMEAAREWAESKGFDPYDDKIPAAFFIGYMAYVDSHMKSRYKLLSVLQDVLRGWGYDVKMNMQSHELLYKGRIAE